MAHLCIFVAPNQEDSTSSQVLTLIARYVTIHWKDGTKTRVRSPATGDLASWADAADASSSNGTLPLLDEATKITVHLYKDIVTQDCKTRFTVFFPDKTKETKYQRFNEELHNIELMHFFPNEIPPVYLGVLEGDRYGIALSETVNQGEEEEIDAQLITDALAWCQELKAAKRLSQVNLVLACSDH